MTRDDEWRAADMMTEEWGYDDRQPMTGQIANLVPLGKRHPIQVRILGYVPRKFKYTGRDGPR